jgi:ABC-type phosphate/phosphonate transport system substrate-binding protein
VSVTQRDALIANARMYSLTPLAAEAWRGLFAMVSESAGMPLKVVDHPHPKPLDALWSRPDLGLVFLCGYPFAKGDFAVRPIAAPVPSAGGERRPVYASDFIVRAGSRFRSLADTFGGTIGWTVKHSQSGFQAVRHHLMRYRKPFQPPLYARAVGELVTPRRLVEAVLAGEVDVGPLDSHVHTLLRAHEPQIAARLRVVETTEPAPMPLLVASASVGHAAAERLRQALVDLARLAEAQALLRVLAVDGFVAVERGDYAVLLARAEAASAAGHHGLA